MSERRHALLGHRAPVSPVLGARAARSAAAAAAVWPRLFGLSRSLPCFTLWQFTFISLCIVILACFVFPWLPAARRQTRVPRLWLHQYYLVLYSFLVFLSLSFVH